MRLMQRTFVQTRICAAIGSNFSPFVAIVCASLAQGDFQDLQVAFCYRLPLFSPVPEGESSLSCSFARQGVLVIRTWSQFSSVQIALFRQRFLVLRLESQCFAEAQDLC